MTTQSDTAKPMIASEFHFTRETVVAAGPVALYDLISEVSNIGRWSPTAESVAYDDGNGPFAGAWFTGLNRRGDKQWQTRSEVEIADRPNTFAFVVGGVQDGIVRWEWQFLEHPTGGTTVRLGWSLLRLDPVLGASRQEVIALQEFMQSSVDTTLEALARWSFPAAHDALGTPK